MGGGGGGGGGGFSGGGGGGDFLLHRNRYGFALVTSRCTYFWYRSIPNLNTRFEKEYLRYLNISSFQNITGVGNG